MNSDEFLWHAKRGHGECVLVLKNEDISKYKKVVNKVFLNNYAFLLNDEYRSSYSCELVSFYHDDEYFLRVLWSKIRRTKLENYYLFDYLINNLFFMLSKSKNYSYENKLKQLLMKNLNVNYFSLNANNSICSLLSLIIDLKIDIPIVKIIDWHYTEFKKSNLDLSSIEYFYHISLMPNRINNCLVKKRLKEYDLKRIIVDNDSFNKRLPRIINDIDANSLCFLLDLLDSQIESSTKLNILKVVLYTKERDLKTINKVIKNIDKSTSEQKNIIYRILMTVKSKTTLSLLYNYKLEDSFVAGLILNNYCEDEYFNLHKKILKLKINYQDSDNWFEIESDLIKYFNKKNIDTRLLNDLKYFFKNGLSSTSRYKSAIILEKYNMLDNSEIEALKYDANYKTRLSFRSIKK